MQKKKKNQINKATTLELMKPGMEEMRVKEILENPFLWVC